MSFNASQLEIYNETIRDLLAEEGGVVLKSQPKHCDRTGATKVAGLTEHPVTTTEQGIAKHLVLVILTLHRWCLGWLASCSS